MLERDMWWKLALVGVLCAMGFNATFPMQEKLKYGIDLYGGYSLLYEIDDSGLDAGQKRDLSERVMKVLQERVDPSGVLNLVWRPIGSNRLEIQMPRPSEQVLQHRQEFDKFKDDLKAKNLKRGDVVEALSRLPNERRAALDALVRGVESRRKDLAELATLADALSAAKAAKNVDAVSDAEDRLDKVVDALLARNVDLNRLQLALDAGPKSAFRREEMGKIKSAAPEQAAMIDKVVAAYDGWRTRRGTEGILDDPADLQRLLRGAGVLEFRMLAEMDPADPTKFDTYRENLKKFGPRPRPGEETYKWLEIEKPRDFFRHIPDFQRDFERRKLSERSVVEKYGEKFYVLAYQTVAKTLTHQPGAAEWSLKNAATSRDEQGRPAVAFELDERGGAIFDSLTRQNKGKLLCIFLDDKAVSSAEIKDVIRTRGIIHGSFTPKEVQDLVKKLNAGSLPRKLKEPPISVRSVGPSLGQANREAGLRSAQYAAVAVVLFMILFYFYAGVIAIVALAINLLLTLAVLAMLSATLTLPGVAGLVLSIGMAVDANILINERIREELAKGAGLRMAIRLGYERAFSAILDSNLTTFITSVILYWIASEEIKGFGLTLAAGVVINLFSAVFVTRLFFEFMTATRVSEDMIKRPLLSALLPALAGGLLWAAAVGMTDPARRAQSVSIGFGRLLVTAGAGILLLYVLMWMGRLIHRAINPGDLARLPMLRLIGVPRIGWYAKRRAFYAVSLILTIAAVVMYARRDPKDLYDIEFLGGTAAQIDLKTPSAASETVIRERLGKAADELRRFAGQLASATVTAKGSEFSINAPGVPASRLREYVQAVLADWLVPNGLRETTADQLTLVVKPELNVGVDAVAGTSTPEARLGIRGGLARVAASLKEWAEALGDVQLQAVSSLESASIANASWEIVSRITSKEVVVSSILSTMDDLVNISPALSFGFKKNDRMGGSDYFPIADKDLPAVTGDPSLVADLSDWRGGVCMVLDQIRPPQTLDSLRSRLKAMRLQPGFEQSGWRDADVLGLAKAEGASDAYRSVAVVVSDENYAYDPNTDSTESWRTNLAEPEVKLVREALERQTSLGKITQFAPQVAQESKQKAIIALVLSWLAIIIYVWFRFGSAVWGTAAVVALVHDVLVALGFVGASFVLSQTAVGHALLIESFRIDLAMVAALLTVIGYSVNDTIIVFDRIRENRGKLTEIRPHLIDSSINQTLSRTTLTVWTVLLTIIIMYIFGGRGIHGFTFAMLIGTLTGSYSSIFVASPLLIALRKRIREPARQRPAAAAVS